MKINKVLPLIVSILLILFALNSSCVASVDFSNIISYSSNNLEEYNYWYSEYMKGTKVGWRNEKRTKGETDGTSAIISTAISDITLSRLGSIMHSREETKYYEALSGQPLKFEAISSDGKSHETKIEGVFTGDKINLRTTSFGSVTTAVLDLPGVIIFPYSADRLYKRKGRTAFNYKTIIPNMGAKIVNVDVKYIDNETIQIAGNSHTLNKYQISIKEFPTLNSYEWRNDDGIIYKSTTSVMNSTSLLTNELDAKKIESSKKVDIIEDNIVFTEKVISDPRLLKKVLYKFTLKKGEPKKILILDKRQNIKKDNGNEVYLEVNSYFPDYLLYSFPFDDRTLDPYLRDNTYIQPSYPKILFTAKKVIGTQKNTFLAAKALEKWVFNNIKEKNYDFGMATSSEAIENLKGDCTEHAVLLAALCRSVGIPSKIVVGLVYVPIPGSDKGSFAYHMWNEVYVGEWINLDASMFNDTVADATHIALYKSSMNQPDDSGNLSAIAMNMIGNIELEVLDYTSSVSGSYDLSNLTQLGSLNTLDLSTINENQIDDSNLSMKKINLENFKNKTEFLIDKFNITGLPNISPILETYEGNFTKGMGYYAKGDIDKALNYFKKAASLIPKDNAKNYYDMGIRLSALMVFDLAKIQFEKAIELDNELWSGKAKVALEKYYPKGEFNNDSEKFNITGFSFSDFANNPPAAILMYEKAIDISPGFESALYNLAKVQSMQGDSFSAIDNYNKAIRINPGNELAYAGLAMLYEADGNYKTAINYYNKAAQYSDNNEYSNEMNYKKTAIETELAVNSNPKNYAAYTNLGNAALKIGQFDQAIKAFIKALNINDRNYIAHKGLGIAYFEIGKPIEAEDELKLALKYNSREHDALIHLGIIERRRLKYNNALGYINKALAMSPKNSNYLIELGRTYIEMGQNSKAINAFSQTDNSLGQLAWGQLLVNEGKNDEAISKFKKSISLDPYDARPYKELGKIYLDQDDLIEARNHLEDSINLDTNYADAYFVLGMLNDKEGDKIEAVKNYVISYSINPTSLEAYKNAYRIFEEEDELDKFNLPRPKYVPNKEEKDFLVKLLYLERIRMKASLNFLNTILNNSKYGYVIVNTDYADKHFKKTYETKYLAQLKALYNEAMSSLESTDRLKPVYDMYLASLYSESNFHYKQLYFIDAGLKGKGDNTITISDDLKTAQEDVLEKGNKFYNTIDIIFKKWDPISMDEIIVNSGYDFALVKELGEKAQALQARTDETIQEFMNTGYEKVN